MELEQFARSFKPFGPFEATFQAPSIIIAFASYLAVGAAFDPYRPCIAIMVIRATQAILGPFAWEGVIARANTTVVASIAEIAQGSSWPNGNPEPASQALNSASFVVKSRSSLQVLMEATS